MIQDLPHTLRQAAAGDENSMLTILIAFKEQTLSQEEQAQIHAFLKTQKSPESIYFRAQLYEYGYGVKENVDMAFLLFREAAAKGSPKAIFEVGRHFLEGIGVGKHYDIALEWLSIAANSPNYIPEAMYELGRMYEYGVGVDIDITKAQAWYSKAAKQGHQAAKAKLQI